MFQYTNRLIGLMYTVRLLSRWSVTLSASPLCWVRPVIRWCQAPYIRGSPITMAGRMLPVATHATTTAA